MGNLIRYIAQEDPEKELQNEKYSHRNFIESYVPQTPRRQQQTPTPWSKEALRRSTISERPTYTNPSPKPIPTTDIVKSGLEGFGQGVLGGMERGINATLAGNYNNISNKYLGGGYQKRQKALEQLTEQENLGKLYKYSNYAIEIGARGLRNKGINLIKKRLKLKKISEMLTFQPVFNILNSG